MKIIEIYYNKFTKNSHLEFVCFAFMEYDIEPTKKLIRHLLGYRLFVCRFFR
ncbi:MAG: hypothetical protein LBO62_00025 [Endomicrobium sp.]|nr:hypothetical protein [Endomicrobium sp.]